MTLLKNRADSRMSEQIQPRIQSSVQQGHVHGRIPEQERQIVTIKKGETEKVEGFWSSG